MIFPMENNGDLPVPSTMTSQETTPEVVQRLKLVDQDIKTRSTNDPGNLFQHVEKHYIQMNMSENREKKPTKWIQMAILTVKMMINPWIWCFFSIQKSDSRQFWIFVARSRKPARKPHLGQSLNRLHIQVVGGFIHCDEMRLGPEPAAMAIFV